MSSRGVFCSCVGEPWPAVRAMLNGDCVDTVVDYAVGHVADWRNVRTVSRVWRRAADLWTRNLLAADQPGTSAWRNQTRTALDVTDSMGACTTATVRCRLHSSSAVAISKMLLVSLHFESAEGEPCRVCRSLNCGPRPVANVGWILWGQIATSAASASTFIGRIESVALRLREDCATPTDTHRISQLSPSSLRKVTLVETKETKDFHERRISDACAARRDGRGARPPRNSRVGAAPPFVRSRLRGRRPGHLREADVPRKPVVSRLRAARGRLKQRLACPVRRALRDRAPPVHQPF